MKNITHTMIPEPPSANPKPRENMSSKSKGIVAFDLYKFALSSSIVAISSAHIKGKYKLRTFSKTLIPSVGLI